QLGCCGAEAGKDESDTGTTGTAAPVCGIDEAADTRASYGQHLDPWWRLRHSKPGQQRDSARAAHRRQQDTWVAADISDVGVKTCGTAPGTGRPPAGALRWLGGPHRTGQRREVDGSGVPPSGRGDAHVLGEQIYPDGTVRRLPVLATGIFVGDHHVEMAKEQLTHAVAGLAFENPRAQRGPGGGDPGHHPEPQRPGD